MDSQTDFQAVVSKTHRPNHVLHLILSILTAGLWLIVWLILALKKKRRSQMVLVVTESGEVRGA